MATAKKVVKRTATKKPVKKFTKKVEKETPVAPAQDAAVEVPLEEGPPPIPEPVIPPSPDVSPLTTASSSVPVQPSVEPPAAQTPEATVPTTAVPSQGVPPTTIQETPEVATVIPQGSGMNINQPPQAAAENVSGVAEPPQELGVSNDLSSTPKDSEGSGAPGQNTSPGLPIVASAPPGDSEGGSKKKLILIFLSVMVLTILLAGGAYYYYANFMTKKASTPAPTPQSEKKAEVTPTPEEKELSEYSVQVLNGSGTAGQAGKVAELLTSGGFENIDTGNADSYDYGETEIQLREKTPKAVYDAIVDSLKDSYAVTRSENSLSDDSEYEVVIIVGKDKPDTSEEDEEQ